ncbi:MAG: 3-carboxy-cis,cis-muconate cycloisomerase [Actinomycetota bacterium]
MTGTGSISVSRGNVKPSSSNSDPWSGGLFDGVLAHGAVREEVSDRAWLQAMLDVEAALARAQSTAGLMDPAASESIARACRGEDFDIAAIGREAADSGNPVVPLVRALRATVDDPAVAGLVHRGATSQDILDSAAMLVAHRALGPLLGDLGAAADATAAMAATHRDTLMAGRTLLQHALPITFGFKAAGWTIALDEGADRLDTVRRTRLAAQLGGAAGTLSSLGEDGLSVLRAFAEDLGLVEPTITWHTDRTRVGELAGALGVASGAIGKVARDVVLMAQTEVAEVREGVPGRGGSSTLPHKRNAVAAVAALAGAEQAPALVATLLATMAQEHERAAGSWHAEWRPLTGLLETVGSAAAWIRDCLEHLEVDAENMRANLDLTGGLLLAERVVEALAPALGRQAADDLVRAAAGEASAGKRSFDEALLDRPKVAEHLEEAEIARLLDPAGYLGSAGAFVDRVLDRRRRGPGSP